MYLTLVFLPLLGTLTAGFFGSFIGSRGAAQVTITCMIVTFILSCICFYEVALGGSPCYIQLSPWFDSEMFSFHWGFQFDTLTCVMLIVVTSISMFVHIYSTEYMSQDPHLQRFLSYLSFFTFFMLILVTADNFLQMFMGWEGVGLCSYLLINFWYARIQANKAALKAMFINRIGDFGLALGIFMIFYLFQSVEYDVVFNLVPKFMHSSLIFFDYEVNIITLIAIFLFVGCVGKSAQLGLHTWLPDAMEGPTPVSALIHAATMVTAGVFLLARCSPLFQYSDIACSIVAIFGAMTSFVAATTGLLQNDLKRVIAYSTCSQLGYMVFACGLSGYSVGIFHLANHAFFKALLFLSAGSVIHAVGDEQDMRKMGGLMKLLPFTYGMIVIGSLALMGFPFLAGFYSKDIILELAYGTYTVSGHFAYWLGTFSAFFTAFYSIRLLSLTFLRPTNTSAITLKNVHEAPFRMALPLFFLSIASIFIGFISRDMMIGVGSDFWGNSLFTLPSNFNFFEAEWIDFRIKLIPLIFSLSGAAIAFWLYNFNFSFLFKLKTSSLGLYFYNFLNRKWFFDKIYNEVVTQNILQVSYKQIYQNMDRGVIEFLGPHGISSTLYGKSYKLTNMYTGFLFHHVFMILLALLALLIIFNSWFLCIYFIDLRVVLILSVIYIMYIL